MALTGSPRFRGIYDDKRCFETYMNWGKEATHAKLREWCQEVGMVNPQTGKASQMGAFWAVWRYAMEHPEEAFPLYRYWWYDTDPLKRMPNFRDFLLDIQRHAYKNKSIASTKKYENFCEKYRLNLVPEKPQILERPVESTLPLKTVEKEKTQRTATAEQVLQFIIKYKSENDGVSPSIHEIRDACGLSSTSSVDYHLEKLVEEKKIIRSGIRQIVVVGGEWRLQGEK